MWFDINRYVRSIDYFLEHVAMALMGEWPPVPRYPEIDGSNLGAGNLKKSRQKFMYDLKNQRSREI